MDIDEDSCNVPRDPTAMALQGAMLFGIIIAYLPQHLRIIAKRSSEGFSPWFLLLGATSASSGLINVISLQWESIQCCRNISAGLCFQSLSGVEIVGTQWAVFTLILVLFLLYFPPHLKYVETRATPHPGHPKATCECEPCTAARAGPQVSTSAQWKLAVILACVVALHLLFCVFITVILLQAPYLTPEGRPNDRILAWATMLGLVSTSLAFVQYTPQLLHTYRAKLVGAISIPAMCIQTPGAVLMVYLIASGPGTNWTSWMVYAASGCLQGSLLVMCLFWKARQHRLHIDDFGNPLDDVPGEFDHESAPGSPETGVGDRAIRDAIETTPLLHTSSVAHNSSQISKKGGYLARIWR